MERRINSRLPAEFAVRARREFWQHKQAESQADIKADINNVNEWLARFHLARNNSTQG